MIHVYPCTQMCHVLMGHANPNSLHTDQNAGAVPQPGSLIAPVFTNKMFGTKNLLKIEKKFF